MGGVVPVEKMGKVELVGSKLFTAGSCRFCSYYKIFVELGAPSLE